MVSQAEFSRLASVSARGIRRAQQEGRLVTVGTDLDPDDPTNAAFIAAHQPGAAGITGRAAQLGALLAKARLVEYGLDRTEASYLNRVEVVELWAAWARRIQARLATLPDRQAEQLATQLGCPLATARSILQAFTASLQAETWNFEEQARAAILQLR